MRHVLRFCFAALAAMIALVASANPLFDGWYADPQIRRFAGKYWIYPTASKPFDEQTYFDAFSSDDLVHWEKHARVLATNAVAWAKRAMWAPDVQEKDGKYYFFFAANDAYPKPGKYGGIGVAVAERPEGPYRDLIGKPLVDEFWNGAQPIDQYVFKYLGGWYMVYGGWGKCNLVKLADDFTRLVPFEDGAMWRDMTPKDYVEGSVVFERKGRWYFMYSAGDWTRDTYRVNYAVAATPFGPWEFKGAVLENQPPIATGAGHNSVISLAGTDDWYIAYHRRPIPNENWNHRVVCLDRLFFDENGDILPVKMTR